MANYLYKKYIKGDFIEVWNQIESVEISEMTPEFRYEISMILKEFMNRTKTNIKIIVDNLSKIEYQFKEVDLNGLKDQSEVSKYPTYAPPQDDVKIEIKKLAAAISPFGKLPESIFSFYENVGTVNLIGHFPEQYDEHMLPLLDPLMVFPINELVGFHDYLIQNMGSIYKNNGDYYLMISYDENIKEGLSGQGGGIGIGVYPQNRFDSIMINYSSKLSFTNYLRLSFKWAGFPNLEWCHKEANKNLQKFIKEVQKQIVPL